ncbi:MAG: copper amine oxidase N-terminal domain-containing protein [Clostridiales bacterium]|nr:copper amine oxidase N-terminal domain-containing protein [Eubacteriales bacterium]MDH7566571.1 copper amine oxidase N-terminal domain-containing protein [Clostridiales bacterium]
MKKFILSVFLMAAVLISNASFSYAAGSIVESPHLKININGEIGTYTDVPLIKDGRTLLPLRAVLTNLGVQNDDQHIVWKQSDRSVAVYSDSTEITLGIDKNTAYVNKTAITLDVAPILYNNRTYVPVRFVSQSLGKKVVWDPSAAMALIRDESEFDRVKGIVEKTTAAMNSVDRYKTNATLKFDLTGEDAAVNSTMELTALTDIKNKTGYTAMTLVQSVMGYNSTTSTEMYAGGNVLYVRNPFDNTWEKKEMDEETYNAQFVYSEIDNSDISYAGLVVADSSNPDEILLKGDIAMEKMLRQNLDDENIGQYKLDTAYTEITIDKNTNLVKKVYVKVSGTADLSAENVNFDMELTSVNSDYNGDFEVNLPEDLP